jgi:hypothetical protein
MRVLAGVVVAVVVLAAGPPAAAGDGRWVWPVEGRVLNVYSNDDARPYAGGMHRGIDIAAAAGTGVVAAHAGTVTHAGVVGSSGLTVAVRTADGRYVTSYLHLSSAVVREGQAVAAGARIGAVGTSGRRSVPEPHLHFGVRLADAENRYVDPLSLLPPRAAPAAPPPPAPVPAPVRVAPQAEPVPAAVSPRPVPAREPASLPRPARRRGALRPGPAAMPQPAAIRVTPRTERTATARPTRPPARVPAAPLRAPAVTPHGAPAMQPMPELSEPGSGPGRRLVAAGLGLVALVLFGGAGWRAVARANAGAHARATSAVLAVRDRVRIGQALRRLVSP